MPSPDTGDPNRRDPAGPTTQFQRNLRSSVPYAAASYTLIGGIIVLGGLGYLADGWLGTEPWLLLAGLLLGLIVGFYELAVVIWGRGR